MMRIFSTLTALALFGGVAATNVLAADEKPKPTPEEAFKKLDKDSDGKLTIAEYKGKREGEKAAKAEEFFKKLDKDSDGSVTLEEFKAGMTKKAK